MGVGTGTEEVFFSKTFVFLNDGLFSQCSSVRGGGVFPLASRGCRDWSTLSPSGCCEGAFGRLQCGGVPVVWVRVGRGPSIRRSACSFPARREPRPAAGVRQ